MSTEKYTQYELDTYEGRCLCDEEELKDGYCGSCPLEVHVKQMRDPKSWVHLSKGTWYKKASTK